MDAMHSPDFAPFLAARLDEAEAGTDPGPMIPILRAIVAEHGPSRTDPSRCRVCTAIVGDHAARFRAPCPTLRWLLSFFDYHEDYQHALWAPPDSALAEPDA